ncbi:MAG: serine/threonine-protein phosphatase [Planctomycetes bacterium]|nr:serine/threonine-protein phosphatase [Planctomycetota bacterium]
MPRPHVQVVLGVDEVPQPLEVALQRMGATASFCPLLEALRGGLSPSADAVVVVAPDNTREISDQLKVLFDRLADSPRATLVVKPNGRYMPRLNHPPTVPVSFSSGLSAEELATRLTTMVEMRPSLEYLHRGMMATAKNEQAAAKRYKNQLQLASQVQREFLPESLPRYGPVAFSALFRPVDYVSGDIYDVQRLDECHVGIAVADATGHGIPAALLTVFIKRALRGKEIENGSYRLLAPDEVLTRLNEEILEANLTECRFVAATYAVLNIQTLQLAIARGGTPYPILRRADGTARLVRPRGGVVGVMPEATYTVEEIQLERGDALVIYSDGLDKLVVPQPPLHALTEVFAHAANLIREQSASDRATGNIGNGPGSGGFGVEAWANSAASQRRTVSYAAPAMAVCEAEPGTSTPRRVTMAPDEEVTRSTWYEVLRQHGAAVAMDQLTVRFDMLRRIGHSLDDLTVLAVQVDG